MLEINNISKNFGQKKAVSDLSFKVRKGDILGFIGPNGAGKSTTMRIITGFIPPDSGNVSIAGHDIETEPKAAKQHIGYLPENAPLYYSKTVLEFLSFIAEIRGFSGREKKRKVAEVLQRCFLEPVKNQVIDTLSKGYRHRTCFAQAILHDPDILILDEPTDGLDPNQKREMRNLIKSMGQNKAIILSTHILEEVEAVTNRVLLIADGKKVYEGTPEDLKLNSLYAGSIIFSVSNADEKNLNDSLASLSLIREFDFLAKSENNFTLRITHTAKKTEQLTAELLEKAFSNSWQVKEIKVDSGELESVFADLTLKKSGGVK